MKPSNSPDDPAWQKYAADSLVWMPERGIGWFPVREQPYDQDYFEKYAGYADTEMGRALTAARVSFVARHYDGPLIDVGIGCGQFVESRPQTTGYDVNPAGIQWLKDRGLYADLYAGKFRAASFWDSLEHIYCPSAALGRVTEYVFVSIPIFHDVEHLLKSKHFRKDEHVFYYTRAGLIDWMRDNGFKMTAASWFESSLGREDIESFVFKRF